MNSTCLDDFCLYIILKIETVQVPIEHWRYGSGLPLSLSPGRQFRSLQARVINFCISSVVGHAHVWSTIFISLHSSDYYEHFYSDLRPGVHYIPFKSDLSDLIERIEWAKRHDGEARQIGANGRRYASEHLLPKDIICYHAVLFKVSLSLLLILTLLSLQLYV